MKDLDCTVFTFLEERKMDATVSILSSQRFYFSQGTSIMIQTENTAIRAAKGKDFQKNCRACAFSWEGSDYKLLQTQVNEVFNVIFFSHPSLTHEHLRIPVRLWKK